MAGQKIMERFADMRDCTLCPRGCHADRTGASVDVVPAPAGGACIGAGQTQAGSARVDAVLAPEGGARADTIQAPAGGVYASAPRRHRGGFCQMPDTVTIARAALHMWEEPCISGTSGSGTVFFSGCTLRCVFCQNYHISTEKKGYGVSIPRLADIFLELEEAGANNINLVTPTHFVPQIIRALELGRQKGLALPIVYNTSGYEKVETLKMLEGYVDIYLPDFKYVDPVLSGKYSGAPDYFEKAAAALEEMVRQVPQAVFAGGQSAEDAGGAASASEQVAYAAGQVAKDVGDGAPAAADVADGAPTPEDAADGAPAPEDAAEGVPASGGVLMKRGVIVRHLMLPGCLLDSKRVVRYLYETYGDQIYLSLMNQYTPLPTLGEQYPELSCRVKKKSYEKLIQFALSLGVTNAFIQEGETAKESFIPDFDGQGVFEAVRKEY